MNIDAIFSLGKAAIERIWPDPIKRSEELRKLEELKQRGELAELEAHVELMTAQLNINAAEAKHKSLFVAGWRPAIGWIFGSVIFYNFVLYPLMLWGWAVFAQAGLEPPPRIESDALWQLISGMLGMSAMRTYDKIKHVQTDILR